MTNQGLKQYSLPDLSFLNVIESTSNGYGLEMIKKMNRIIFSDNKHLFVFNFRTFEVIKLEKIPTDFIFSIVSTLDEKYFFTAELDLRLKKWSTDTWDIEKSVSLSSAAYTLFVKENSKTLYVGLDGGYLSEFTIKDLSLLRNIHLHNKWIRKIIRLKSGDVMTCSEDGHIKFPFSEIQPIKTSGNNLNSIIELSDKTIACCYSDSVHILTISEKHLLKTRSNLIKYSKRRIYSNFCLY